MSNELKPAEANRPRLGKAGTLARFALIGVALAAVAGTFAYLGGWFTPNELTPARFTDGFEQVNGVHSGFRRNHAKGLVRGRTLTSYHTIQDDIRNAGGNWVDRKVVEDDNWVTSRQPDDLPAFNRAMISLFSRSRRAVHR
jgi:putative intracellular protease/amidase